MEKRIKKKVDEFISSFKKDLITKLVSEYGEEEINDKGLAEYIYDYNRLTIEKEDFMKRKRNIIYIIKNIFINKYQRSIRRLNSMKIRCLKNLNFHPLLIMNLLTYTIV